MLSSVIKKNSEINKTVVVNVLKMLKRRNLIESVDTYMEKFKDIIEKEKVFEFKEGANKFSIYIVNSRINSVVSKSPLDEYLRSNVDTKKIILIDSTRKGAIKQILNFKNTEFFLLENMMEDLPSKKFIPEHQLLSDEMKSKLSDRFNLKDFAEIKTSDIMARYYGAKVNDVFRIIRKNLTTGNEVAYRVVTEGSLDNYFL